MMHFSFTTAGRRPKLSPPASAGSNGAILDSKGKTGYNMPEGVSTVLDNAETLIIFNHMATKKGVVMFAPEPIVEGDVDGGP